MSGVIRTWACQSERCGAEFDSWDRYPACPDCGNVRTAWVPGGGHVGGSAGKLDATLRDLATAFDLTDLNSAKTGERAKPALPTPQAATGPQIQFAPGFTAPVTTSAACMPSTTKVNFKARVAANKSLPASQTYPHPRSATITEARHTGK